MGDGLDEFLLILLSQSYHKIATVLKENDFTSRLSLKLVNSENEKILKKYLQDQSLGLGFTVSFSVYC